nr:hypothetical protein [Ktedonospora formicarum]
MIFAQIFAYYHRGYRFGSILINLESHRVVDLLPEPPSRNRRCVDAPTTRPGRDQS